MKNLYEQVVETVEFIQSVTDFKPKYGIILGTGLSNLANDVEVITTIKYKNIINFPISTVQSHKGELITLRVGTSGTHLDEPLSRAFSTTSAIAAA